MTAAMRGEWLKLRTVRSPKVLVAIAVLLTWLIAGLSTRDYDGSGRPVELVAGAGTLTLVLLLVLGVQMFAQEYRFGTIRTTFTAVPVRRRVVSAKVMVGAAVGGVTGALAVGGAALVTTIVLSSRGYDLPSNDRLAEVAIAYVIVGALAVVFGIGVGALTRNPAFGITLVLVLGLVVEPLVSVFTSADVARGFPLMSGFGAFPYSFAEGTAFTPWYVSALVFAAWSSLLVVGGGLMVERRDA
ncbi:MAG TPA: ABC transporter permease [Acidimicrobiia bacterium]|nr:ABC transporter permease [Acidimicrobiia bacterium]